MGDEFVEGHFAFGLPFYVWGSTDFFVEDGFGTGGMRAECCFACFGFFDAFFCFFAVFTFYLPEFFFFDRIAFVVDEFFEVASFVDRGGAA